MQMRARTVLWTVICGSSLGSACATGDAAAYRALRTDYAAVDDHQRGASEHAERALATDHLERTVLVAAVLDRNPTIEAARQSWRAAMMRHGQAGAYDDPMVDVGFAPLSIASSRASFGAEIGISQRIALGSKRSAEQAVAVAEAQAMAGDYRAARLLLALSASQLYDDYYVAVRSLEINQQQAELMVTLKQSAIVAYETGHAAAQDPLQAESEAASLEYEAVRWHATRDVVVTQLNALLHRAPSAPLPEPPRELPVVPRDDPRDDRVQTAAVEARPDVTAAQARVRVQSALADVADQQKYPELVLSTSYNSMWDMPEHRWMAGVGISIPWQTERRHAALEEASALRAAAASEVERVTDEAHAQLAVAGLRVAEAAEALRLHEVRLLPVARAQVDAAQSGFVTAQNNFSTLIGATDNLRAVELNAVLARAELSKRQAELDLAYGRIPGVAATGAVP